MIEIGKQAAPGVRVYSAAETECMDAVAEALCNALQNGHDFRGWTSEAIADDMIECGGIDPDEFPYDLIVAAIAGQRS